MDGLRERSKAEFHHGDAEGTEILLSSPRVRSETVFSVNLQNLRELRDSVVIT